MRILVVEPGKPPVEQVINGDLSEMQDIVGGTIQALYPFEDSTVLVCNDEGKLLGLPKNRAVYTDDGEIKEIINGTFFLCNSSFDSECFQSLTDYQLQRYKRYFSVAERFYQFGGHLVIVRDNSE